ncbi:MAG: hypothetical protein ACRDEA_17990, partial [Microcystaceae cyanobacterium]
MPLARELKDKKLEAIALNELGFNFHSISQPQEALKYLNQSLPLSRAVGDRSTEAKILNNIGQVY